MGSRPRIETRTGTLEGFLEDGICVFRGVPYARPPTGRWRFRAPEPPEPWAGVRDASRFGFAAPQVAGALMRFLGLDRVQSNEDCLTLNVWTPALDAARRPILVWFHGGAFTRGAGSQELYDGRHLARRGDVVVVTLNYRLGALGFLALPDRDEPDALAANFGLLDQLAALAWVREHADRLGGDPDAVTVFGESAGAMSLGALLGASSARGLFRRAILESGAAHDVFDAETAVRVREILLKELGLAPGEIERLWQVPVDALVEAQQRTVDASWRDLRKLAFEPVIDGRLLRQAPLTAIAEGAARGVDCLVGTNRDEWRLFVLSDTRLRTLNEAGLLRRLARTLPLSGSEAERRAREAVAVYSASRAERGEPADPRELWLALETDRMFRVPAVRLAERQAPHAPGTRLYLFDWASPALGGALGSCHALEIPFVFGTFDQAPVSRFVGAGPEAARLSARIQDAWLGFARHGDPAHPDLGEWPPYDTVRHRTMRLGRECRVEDDPLGPERRFWETLL